MKIIFFGTSVFAVPSLEQLAASDHQVSLVVTQPDRPKGRNLKLAAPAVKDAAKRLHLPLYQPEDALAADAIQSLRKHNADLFVVVAFGCILNTEILSIPKKFSINLHASLLPKYRGAAPINWALINGEKTTGVTVFRLNEVMDAGDIIIERSLTIEDEDTAITVSEKLSGIGAITLREAVDLIARDKVVFKKQDRAHATFARKLKKSDGVIDWGLSAVALMNRVRGLIPWPGAFTTLEGRQLKILDAAAIQHEPKDASNGQIVEITPDSDIVVKTNDGCLVIKRLQLEGSRPMGCEEFLRGHTIAQGYILGR